MKISALIFICLFLSQVSVSGQAPRFTSPCEEKVVQLNNYQFQSGMFNTDADAPKKCFIMISPIERENEKYRSYVFTTDGQMQIFNSFAPGEPSKNTGASVFYFFPFKGELKYNISDNAILMELTNGEIAEFDTLKGEIIEVTNAIVQTDPDINPNNNGGVRLEYLEGWTLNTGFQLGGSPLSNPLKEIFIRDSLGTQCNLKISDFFSNINEEYSLKYPSNEALRTFQAAVCPNLNIW